MNGMKHLLLPALLVTVIAARLTLPAADAFAGDAAVPQSQSPQRQGADGDRDSPEPAGKDIAALQNRLASSDLQVYEGTPVGFTEEVYPFRGDPDAPVTVVEYSDYLCPYCARHFNQTLPTLLEKHVRTGQLKLVFRDFPIAKLHPTAAKGAAAALCVAEQGAVRFWSMHDALYRRQNEWNRLPDPGEFLAGIAEEIGVDRAAYDECVASGRTARRVEESVAEGKGLGFKGTPSFQFVNNKSGDTYTMVGAQPMEVFAQWTDALAAGKAPPEPKKPELPLWAKPEGLAPDPDRPGWTMAGDAYKGDPQAKLAVVEFADFQCPACGRHALQTQPVLDEQFVETGKLLWVVKHFPLRMHPHAPAAAAAAECAADQGRFWDMHHRLYQEQERWAQSDDVDAALVTLAETVDLEIDVFTECFQGRNALERVLRDMYDAQGVVRTTPTFVVLHDGKASVVRGARRADQFVAILNRMHEAVIAENDRVASATE